MNFLLDENFPKSARAVLESAGHEVLDFRSLGIIGSPDEAVVRMALEKSAAILTTDRDFFHTLGRQYPANGVRCHISTNSGDVFINRLLSVGVVRRAKQGASYQVKDLLFQNLASRNYRVLQLC
jgi:predicted nuclease of predicted toxin-antitoxin system